MKRYSKSSSVRKLSVKRGSHKIFFCAEILNQPLESLNAKTLDEASAEIRTLITRNWGDFGLDFTKNHVLSSNYVVLLRDSLNELVGLASISQKNVLGRNIYYFEMTVVDKEVESLKLSYKLNYLILRKVIFENLLRGKVSLEFMLITPNMKILGSLANMADFIYPDPYLFDRKKGKILPADEQTWEMSRNLILNSDNPKRKLIREGCVLEGSYKNTPELLYKPGSQPKYVDDIVNDFGETYLHYSKAEDRELVVRVKFNLYSIIRAIVKDLT